MIGLHDCRIAATVLVQDAIEPVTLVTDSLTEFRRVPGLKLVNRAKH